MWHAFNPVDYEHRACYRLHKCTQTGSVIDFMAALCAWILECTNISVAEVLDLYVAGLKPTTRNWVLIDNLSTMHEAAK